MQVLIVGGGGREHALAWAFSQSPRVSKILCAPGNAGTAELAENVDVAADDLDEFVRVAKQRAIDLVVVGPEAPLCAGLVDRLEQAGIKAFGPTAAAARIEGDKAYAKRLMKIANVPTGEARVFTRYEDARAYVATRDTGVVVKACGLAAGKGVSVCQDPADALEALEQMMVERAFGEAGDVVLIEELLKGQELSVLALVSGSTILVLETAQDHKAVGDGDTGPNTGGMGAYSPAPLATPEIMDVVERQVLVPIIDAMRNEGSPYRGVLYAGLMVTAAGPKVLEFNCRFGDPETQAVLMRLDSDLFELLTACVDDHLEQTDIQWKPQPAVCVVMASEGYPGAYAKGKVISGLDRVAGRRDVAVFHAGTTRIEDYVISDGGRVLGVTALGDDLADARRRAYEATKEIEFDGAFCRSDIANKAVGALGASKR
ncbi:MAG: phosphoribosylamine--glycine ligase [Phycisphaerae bacterium]